MPDKPAAHDAPATQHRVIPVEWHRVAVEAKCPRCGSMDTNKRLEVYSDSSHCDFRVCGNQWHNLPADKPVEPTDNAPARVDRERVCATCEKWVYYDNGDVTFHCGCNAHWKWRDVPAAQPANTDEPRCLARTREGLECAYKPHDSRNHCWFDPDSPPPEGMPLEPVPAANTDDRTADTIPDDLKRDYELATIVYPDVPYHPQIGRLIERTGRAETRIEVLEAALRDMLTIAELDEWDKASTGRQIVYRATRVALAGE